MKPILALSLGLLAAGAARAENTNLTDQTKAAIANLKAQTSYSWTVKVELPTMGFTPSPLEGKTEKDGFTFVSQDFNDNAIQAAFKGDKVVVKNEDEWQVFGGTGGDGGGTMMMTWWLPGTRTPVVEAGELIGRVSTLTAGDGGLVSGDLTAEGAKEMLTFGRRPGGDNAPPPPKNAKASVKFWLKDGALVKFESHVQGTVAFGPDQEEREMDMTRTVDIHDVGKTKVEVPAEAKKKLEAK